MTDREANERGHPPACTCVACSAARVQKAQRGSLLDRLLRTLRLKR